MVGMDVEAIRIEGGHHGGPVTPNVGDQRSPDLVCGRVGKLAIAVLEDVQLVDAGDRRRLTQLTLATGWQLLGRTNRRVTHLSTFATRGRDDDRPHTLVGVPHRRPDRRKALVVGMRKTEHQTSPHTATSYLINLTLDPGCERAVRAAFALRATAPEAIALSCPPEPWRRRERACGGVRGA